MVPDLATGIAFDVTFLGWLMASMGITLVGALVFLLVRLTRGRHEFWVVACPVDGGRALVRLHIAPEGHRDEVVGCSRLEAGTVLACDQACLRMAA